MPRPTDDLTMIVPFLLARVAQDEAAANLAIPPSTRVLAECRAKRAIIALHSPHDVRYTRMKPEFAEAAKGLSAREWHQLSENPDYMEESGTGQSCNTCDCEHGDNYPCATILALAQVYRDHADYDQAWSTP